MCGAKRCSNDVSRTIDDGGTLRQRGASTQRAFVRAYGRRVLLLVARLEVKSEVGTLPSGNTWPGLRQARHGWGEDEAAADVPGRSHGLQGAMSGRRQPRRLPRGDRQRAAGRHGVDSRTEVSVSAGFRLSPGGCCPGGGCLLTPRGRDGHVSRNPPKYLYSHLLPRHSPRGGRTAGASI